MKVFRHVCHQGGLVTSHKCRIVSLYRVSQKKWAVAFFYNFPSKIAMTTIVRPLERGQAGKSFKKTFFFKRSILRCLNQYSNFPDMQTRFWLYEQKNKNQDKFLRMKLKKFLKIFFFLKWFPSSSSFRWCNNRCHSCLRRWWG